jgi:hypothetical protein
MKPKPKKMPKVLVVYVCDYEDGEPIYCVADGGIQTVSPDAKGEPLGIYKLQSEGKLKVTQEVV